MGIIEKQATKSTIYSYIGAVLGFITVMWSARLLTPDENGLIRILLSVSSLFSLFFGLGFNGITVRLFPYFRNKGKGHHGYLFYGVVITLIGFIICGLFFFIFRGKIIEMNAEKSSLLIYNLFYLLPITLFTLFFNLFDYYLRACYSSVIGSSSKDFTQRVLILLTLLLYFINAIEFNTFLFLYVSATCAPTLILLFYIIKLGELHLKPIKGFVDKKLRNEMIKVSMFSVFVGGAGVLIANLDIIMVNEKLGLSQTGIYGIAFYFGTIITIPSKALLRVTVGIVSEAFKKNNLVEITDIYKKSCNSQLTIGMLLFVGIVINLDNIMELLPAEYASGKNVILFISLGYLVDMGTGVNYIIMVTSKYYKFDGYIVFLTLGITVLTNYILIPIYGITGSAIATAITLSINNILRWLLLFYKFKMQPYDFNIVKILLIALIAFLFGYFIPEMPYWILDLVLRSTITGGVFLVLMLKTEAAPEINFKIRKNLKRFSINI